MPKQNVTLRLDPEVVAEADRIVELLGTANFGVLARLRLESTSVRADVLRAAIIRGLSEIDRQVRLGGYFTKERTTAYSGLRRGPKSKDGK